MGVHDDAERFQPASIDEWSAWLAAHHADTPGVWLVTHKESSGLAAFDYEEAIVEALRWGWIDSTQRTVDEQRTMMWYVARRPGSVWTRRNKVRVATLEADGRMQPAGQAAVDAARASGMWTVMDDVEDLVVPDDLAAALGARPGAREQWDAFPPSARKPALAWIVLAKRDETRAARVANVAESSARGERPRG
ncbi:MAG: YdeI/OmpD-associated family protein [Nocardioides sp.]